MILGIFNIFRPKTGIPTDKEAPDEEYKLPDLSKGDFPMTEELRIRQQDEQLSRRYGVHIKKEGCYK